MLFLGLHLIVFVSTSSTLRFEINIVVVAIRNFIECSIVCFERTYIWISWDCAVCPCYYETGGKHSPVYTTLVAFCMVRSCNWPERRSYPTIWGRHSIGTSPCRERFDQLPGLSRHSQWLVIPWKNNKKIVKLTWVVRGCMWFDKFLWTRRIIEFIK